VNSGGELHLARAAGFEDERIVFNGVAKAENEIESALSIKAINVDSLFELERILRVAQSTGRRANVALRVIPGLSIGSSPGNETGSNTSKFGLLRDEFETALEIMHANASLADLVGLHIHVGSQVRTASAYRSIADYAFDIIRQFDLRLRHVNLGGGYPVDYVKTAAQGLDPGYFRPSVAASDIATAIASSPLFSKGDLEPIVEPGRAVFGDAAVLLARVIGVKKRDVPWLYLDAGYHQMLEQFSYKWYYHALNASRCNETETGKYRLFGPLCDSGDAFHDVDGEGLLAQLLQEPELRNHESVLRRTLVRLPPYRELPAETREGDLIAFLDTGAYTLETMSANNGHVRPEVLLISAEVLLDSAEVTVESIRRRDTLADL
jgi:diaminopimelate decarboxylase